MKTILDTWHVSIKWCPMPNSVFIVYMKCEEGDVEIDSYQDSHEDKDGVFKAFESAAQYCMQELGYHKVDDMKLVTQKIKFL